MVRTSSITLNIVGILKELVTLVLAHFINHDAVSFVNLCGLVLCVCGIVVHAHARASVLSKPKKSTNENCELTERLLKEDNSSDSN